MDIQADSTKASDERKPVLPPGLIIDAKQVPNAVLKRLIEEVRNGNNPGPHGITGFNRTHNRHNRGR